MGSAALPPLLLSLRIERPPRLPRPRSSPRFWYRQADLSYSFSLGPISQRAPLVLGTLTRSFSREPGSPAPPLSWDPDPQTVGPLDRVLQRPSSLRTPTYSTHPSWDPDLSRPSSSSKGLQFRTLHHTLLTWVLDPPFPILTKLLSSPLACSPGFPVHTPVTRCSSPEILASLLPC